MSIDQTSPAGNTDQASTNHLPEHKRTTPEEAARLMAEEEGIPVEDLAAEYREHVERYGPAEVEVHDQIFTVWAEDEPEPGE